MSAPITMDELIALVRAHDVICRIRFFNGRADIDVYYMPDSDGVRVPAALDQEGWFRAGYYPMPDGFAGFRYSHTEVTPERLTKTRALFDRLALAKSDVTWGDEKAARLPERPRRRKRPPVK